MSSKKEKRALRLKVEETLSAAFTGLEGELAAKKFKRNIKKASKALLAGLKVPAKKTPREKVKTAKPVQTEAS